MKPATPDSQPIPPPSVRPADPRVAERAADHREVVRPRRGVDVLPERAARDAHDPSRRIDRDLARSAQVDDQGAVGHRVTGDAVTAAADGDRAGRDRAAATTAAITSSSIAHGRSPPAAAATVALKVARRSS